MIKSMTGFGQATGGSSSLRWTVEIRSLNHRFFECSTRLPNVLLGLEDRIRDFVHQSMKRGKITIAVSLKSKPSGSNGLALDEKKVDFYFKSFKKIEKKYRLKEPLPMGSLLQAPNLFVSDHEEFSSEQYWSSLKGVIEKALKQLLHAKAKEGHAL